MIITSKEFETIIDEFNQSKNEDFSIDSIRVEFNKTYKINKLNQLGVWLKLNKKDRQIMKYLISGYRSIKVTSIKRLKNQNIYYYNLPNPPKYCKAVMVIFGLKQYHKNSVPKDIIESILNILKDVSNIDVCKDFNYKPNIEKLKKKLTLNRYKLTNTYYVNDTYDMNELVKKVVIYDKADKNKLDKVLWRVEANISISNIIDKESAIWLSLNFFKDEIIKILKVL